MDRVGRPRSSLESMVRWGGALFFAGGALAAASVAVPHGPIRNTAVAMLDAVAGMVLGATFYVLAGHVRRWMVQAVVVMGIAQLAVGMQFLGPGPASVTACGFYVWVSVFVFYFFPRRVALAHLALMGVVLAFSLWLLHESAGPGIWLIVMGTAAGAGIVVGTLADQLRAAAGTDGLTGLPNRWSWEDALERELARAARTVEPLCVASIDLDGFKSLNDARGHQAGDLYLRELAAAWSDAIRGNDVLARYGGDEFAVLLPNATRNQALAVVDRMRAETPDACFSSGVAQWDGHESAELLLARADIAVYRAKADGRNVTIVAGDPSND